MHEVELERAGVAVKDCAEEDRPDEQRLAEISVSVWGREAEAGGAADPRSLWRSLKGAPGETAVILAGYVAVALVMRRIGPVAAGVLRWWQVALCSAGVALGTVVMAHLRAPGHHCRSPRLFILKERMLRALLLTGLSVLLLVWGFSGTFPWVFLFGLPVAALALFCYENAVGLWRHAHPGPQWALVLEDGLAGLPGAGYAFRRLSRDSWVFPVVVGRRSADGVRYGRSGEVRFAEDMNQVQAVVAEHNLTHVLTICDPANEPGPASFGGWASLGEIRCVLSDEPGKAADLKSLTPVARHRFSELAQRVLDVLIAGPLALLVTPLVLVSALLVKLTSAGPAFFTQVRLGRNGEPFVMCKLRSMYVEAPAYGESPADEADPRITTVGRWLRYLDIDELPQLWNVLKGEMSLAGPRPEMPHIAEQHSVCEQVRLLVRPGVTGVWQLSPSRHRPIHENIWYDLFYVANRSFFLDLAIVLDTVCYILCKFSPWPTFASGRGPREGVSAETAEKGSQGAHSTDNSRSAP